MNKIEIKKLDEYIYHKVLDNGLNVFIYKTTNTNEYKASFFTKYGSIYNDFKIKGNLEYKKYPLGIAHFLEHKLFESETKEEPMEYFSKSGTDSNAYTSFVQTCYYIEGSNNYENNLNYLIDFVQEPYFTDSNVEKEKGIIEQELNMYNDNPNHVLLTKSLYNLMHNHNIKYDIGGTVETINEITKEMLYDCYNTFYSTNNMTIVVSGNIDVDDTMRIIENNQNSKNLKRVEYELNSVSEPDNVYLEEEIINMNVDIPLFSFSIKIPNKFNLDQNILEYYIDMIFEENFGKKSDFFIQSLEDGLLSYGLSFDMMFTDKHILIILSTKTKKYDELKDAIKLILNKLKISEEFFNRQKKKYISSLIYAFENHSTINSIIEDYIIEYNKTMENMYSDILDLNYEKLNQVHKLLNVNNFTTTIVKSNGNI